MMLTKLVNMLCEDASIMGLSKAIRCMKMPKENGHRCMSIYYEHVRILLATYVMHVYVKWRMKIMLGLCVCYMSMLLYEYVKRQSMVI